MSEHLGGERDIHIMWYNLEEALLEIGTISGLAIQEGDTVYFKGNQVYVVTEGPNTHGYNYTCYKLAAI
jgi:hypothetical protein